MTHPGRIRIFIESYSFETQTRKTSFAVGIMEDHNRPDHDFLRKITAIIETHIEDEGFGVSELAGKIGMSRSNLLRKVNKLTGQSVSQFIRQVRLEKAMEYLREDSYNVSEIAFMVGFSSTSYFIKCFREFYGVPPGEAAKQEHQQVDTGKEGPSLRRSKTLFPVLIAAIILIVLVTILVLNRSASKEGKTLEKSIAVLPFKNDSDDSTNVYLINGLMESLLDDLQQIEDLRVVSRTSVEKYRNNPRTIAEIASELNVNYLVEGSGQKIDNRILLHIQLIEAPTDQRIWSAQYSRETSDIFTLQAEVAQGISGEIKALITPEEKERINRRPTDNLVAYDYFLQGMDKFNEGTREGFEASIPLFEQAIEHDRKFARAYADISIAYSFLDWSQVEKKYTALADEYADRALLYDPELAQSLVAKAAFHMNSREYLQAIPYLEKALEYNPNSVMVINILSDFYTNYLPDTDKYLEYALMGVRLDIGAHDSTDASYIYMHLSNALLQSGFITEAERYIERSLDYNPDNLFSEYLRAYIVYARDGDLNETREMLVETLRKDSTRIDILQEMGKVCYYMRDYKNAYHYYQRFLDQKASMQMVAFPGEDAKIGLVCAELGLNEEADSLFRAYRAYAENDRSMYRHLSLAAYYAYQGESDKAVEHLELFSRQKSYNYLYIPFLKIDPLMDPIKDTPGFRETIASMEKKIQEHHTQIRKTLEEKGLI